MESDANGIVSGFWDGLYKLRIDGSADGVVYTTLYTYDNVAVVDQSTTLSGEGAAIPSASTITLGNDGNTFHITGSTGPITALSGTQNEVTLVFDSTPTLTHSGNLILQYAANYVAAANVVMVFVNEGSGVWREVSRTPAFVDIAANGDLPLGSGNDMMSTLSVGAAGTVLMSRAAATNKLAYVAALSKALYGLTYANNSGDATNDLDLAAGGCMDSTGAYWITNAALTKRSDANWAVGTAQGMLDTGAVGDNDYYLWSIARSDTGVTDFLCSLSSTAPTMPANYDFKRLIGWFKRVSAAIVAFTTYETAGGGIELLWSTPTLDVSLGATLTTTRRTDAIKVPLNFSVIARINVLLNDALTATTYIYCPDVTDQAPSITVAPLGSHRIAQSSFEDVTTMTVRTSATGTIAARSTTTIDSYGVVTLGFTWARRN